MVQLADLSGIGPRMLEDFRKLKVHSTEQLADEDPRELYARLCLINPAHEHICVLDVLTCAVAQARNPKLAAEQRNWWYWSRKRKAAERKPTEFVMAKRKSR